MPQTTLRARLTEAVMAKLKPGECRVDDLLPALSVRAKKNGSAAWYVYFRTKDGTPRRPRLGAWPTISVAKARDLARDAIGKVAQGDDPSGGGKAAKTIDDLVDSFQRLHLPKKKPGTRREYRQYSNVIKAAWAGRKCHTITREEAVELHAAWSHVPYKANRILAVMSKMWNFGTYNLGWKVGNNPATRQERNKEHKRRRVPKPAEVKKIGQALRDRTLIHPDHVAALTLYLITAARKNEILQARAEYVTDNGLELPDSKTGFKVIALPPAARAIIRGLGVVDGKLLGQAASGRRNTKANGKPTTKLFRGAKSFDEFWDEVRTEAGAPDLRLHDFRRLFAKVALKRGISLAQIGSILGHSDPKVTADHYAFLDNTEQTELTEIIGDKILEIMGEAIRPAALPAPAA